MKSSILAAAALAMMLGSCSILNKTTVQTAAPATSTQKVTTVQGTTPPILMGDWSITEVEGQTVAVNGENHPKLSLKADELHPGTVDVIGYNGCNYLNGTWTVGNGHISPAGEFITSMMACPDAPYETAINLALTAVAGYQVNGDDLTLLSSAGRPVMKLHKQNISFLNGAWKVTSIEGQPITAKIRFVIDTAEGRIHGNAGCNLLNGNITVNLDKGSGIEFQNLATSRMMCPYIAVEQAFLLALEQVDTALPGKDSGSAMLCNSDGQTLITLERLSADQLVEE